VFERSDFTHRFLYGWLDCSGPCEGSAGQGRHFEYDQDGPRFRAEVTVRDERNRDIPIEAECSEEMQYG
jgi:hypothetical protein